jgi:hypothetical protein
MALSSRPGTASRPHDPELAVSPLMDIRTVIPARGTESAVDIDPDACLHISGKLLNWDHCCGSCPRFYLKDGCYFRDPYSRDVVGETVKGEGAGGLRSEYNILGDFLGS